jgi:hypothetical protein
MTLNINNGLAGLQASTTKLPDSGMDGSNNVIPNRFVVTLGVATSTLTGTASLTNATASRAEVDGNTVTLTNTPTGGTYTLTFGSQTTSALAHNASVSAVQTALAAMTNIGAGNVTVTGTPTSYTVVFS